MTKTNGLRANRNTTSLNDNDAMDFAFAIPAGTEATYLGYREARMKNVDGSLKSCTAGSGAGRSSPGGVRGRAPAVAPTQLARGGGAALAPRDLNGVVNE